MNNNLKKAILSYTQLELPGIEFDIETHHNEPYLMIVVDWSKMDRNSTNFDESYRKKIYTERPEGHEGIWISNPLSKIDKINTEISKFFNIELRSAFKFTNYDFLEPIQEKIRNAVKKSELPHLEFDFRGDSSKPILEACFYNFNRQNDKENYPNLQVYIKELEKILDNKIVLEGNYSWVFSGIKK